MEVRAAAAQNSVVLSSAGYRFQIQP
jgi:hypothetical protein